jgi:hypothetical protein
MNDVQFVTFCTPKQADISQSWSSRVICRREIDCTIAKTVSYQKVIYSYTRYVGELPEVAKVGDTAVRTPQQWYTYFQDTWQLAAFGTNHPSRSQHQTTDQGCLNLLLLANLLSFPRFSVVANSPNTGITNSRRRTRFCLDISVQLENGTQQWINPPLS